MNELTQEQINEIQNLLERLKFIKIPLVDWLITHNHKKGGQSQLIETENLTDLIDDTAGNGDINVVYSADKVFDLLALKMAISDAVGLAGDQTIAGIKTFSSFPISPSSAPTSNYQVSNKKYVDDSVSAVSSVIHLNTVASASVKNSNDTEHRTTSLTPVKVKEIRLNDDIVGDDTTIRISYRLVASQTNILAHGQIYKNGVAIDSLNYVIGADSNTFTKDVSGLKANDLIQIYCYTENASYYAAIDNFRFCYDFNCLGFFSHTLVTQLPMNAYSTTNTLT